MSLPPSEGERREDREKNIRSQRHTRLWWSPAGVPITPMTQQSAFCSKKVIIKRGENTDFSFLFCIWKVIIKHFSRHDAGLTSEGESSRLSSRDSSRLWRPSHFFWAESSSTSGSAGGHLQGERGERINTWFHFIFFLFLSFFQTPLIGGKLEVSLWISRLFLSLQSKKFILYYFLNSTTALFSPVVLKILSLLSFFSFREKSSFVLNFEIEKKFFLNKSKKPLWKLERRDK